VAASPNISYTSDYGDFVIPHFSSGWALPATIKDLLLIELVKMHCLDEEKRKALGTYEPHLLHTERVPRQMMPGKDPLTNWYNNCQA